MRVTNEQLEDILRGENYGVECDEVNDTNIHAMAADLLEAREALLEIRALVLREKGKVTA